MAMKMEISKIKVAERIRKLTEKIDELATDIQKNGLINPITIMETNNNDEYQLLAGLRRLRAARFLGWTEIDVNIVPPKDAEAALNIEYSENVQREDFTYSEKVDYTRLISEIESAKAKERMSEGGKTAGRSRPQQGGEFLPQATSEEDNFEKIPSMDHKRKPRTRDIIGAKIGMSGKQYDMAKYIAKHASQEIIDELDRNERTITGTYNELRDAEKKSQLPEETKSEAAVSSKSKSISKKSYEKLQEKLATTEEEFKEFVSKYAMANHKRGMLENQLQHVNFQLENERIGSNKIISELREQISELKTALAAANERIRELEKIIEQKETENGSN
jgi:ParB family chromosome partitioning protein